MNQMKTKVVFVDVDDTLVRTIGSKRVPMPGPIAAVRSMKDRGWDLYCWSSGGALYARESAAELGIEACFSGFLSKPDAYLDDQSVADWRYCQHVLPSNADSI